MHSFFFLYSDIICLLSAIKKVAFRLSYNVLKNSKSFLYINHKALINKEIKAHLTPSAQKH